VKSVPKPQQQLKPLLKKTNHTHLVPVNDEDSRCSRQGRQQVDAHGVAAFLLSMHLRVVNDEQVEEHLPLNDDGNDQAVDPACVQRLLPRGTPEDFDWRVPSSAYEDCSGLSPHDLCLLYPFVFSSSAPIPVKIRAGSTVLTSVPQVKMMVDVFF
jgi:hypothetical protein